MADGFKFNIKNNTELRNLLRSIPTKIKDSAYDIIESEVKIAVQQAKSNAMKLNTTGELVNGISSLRDGKKVQYISAAPYSAFVEFGIRTRYVKKPGFEKTAMRFKGISNNGTGLTGMENIYKWAEAKGINKKHWYAIYKKIMDDGFPIPGGKSVLAGMGGFFFQPYYEARNRIGVRLNGLLKKALK